MNKPTAATATSTTSIKLFVLFLKLINPLIPFADLIKPETKQFYFLVFVAVATINMLPGLAVSRG